MTETGGFASALDFPNMAIVWLRVALALYGLGLVYVLVALTRTPIVQKQAANSTRRTRQLPTR